MTGKNNGGTALSEVSRASGKVNFSSIGKFLRRATMKVWIARASPINKPGMMPARKSAPMEVPEMAP